MNIQKKILTILTTMLFVLINHIYGDEIEIRNVGFSESTLSSSSLLHSTVGVRSYAMGEAQTGRANDLSAMHYNPAGLALMGYWEWMISHKDLNNDVDGESLALAIPLPLGSLGVSSTYYRVVNNQHTSNSINDLPDKKKYSYLVGLSYGLPVYKKLINLGLTTKYFSSNFSNAPDGGQLYKKDQSVLFDLGFIAKYNISDLKGGFLYFFPEVSFGGSIKNIQPKFKLRDETRGNDVEYNLGFSMYYNYKFMFNGDIINIQDQKTQYRFGIEYWPIYFLSMRAGFSYKGHESAYRAFHWGLGIGESFGKSKLSFEYATKYEQPDRIAKNDQVYHRFALHQSFEKIFELKDPYGRIRKVRLAQTDRYNTPLQFAVHQEPEEIVDLAVLLALNSKEKKDEVIEQEQKEDDKKETYTEDPVITTTDNKEEEKRPPQIKKKIIVLFPFNVSYVGTMPKETDKGTLIRREMIRKIIAHKKLKSLPEWRYKLVPRQEDRETKIMYLNRLCKFYNAQMLSFGTLVIDENNGTLVSRVVFFKEGDSEMSGEVVQTGFKSGLEKMKTEAAQTYLLQVLGMLNIHDV